MLNLFKYSQPNSFCQWFCSTSSKNTILIYQNYISGLTAEHKNTQVLHLFTIDAIKTSNKTFCMTTPPPPSPSIFHIIALYYRQGISHIQQKRSNIKNNATKLLNMHSLVIIYHTWFVITIRCLDRKRLVFRAACSWYWFKAAGWNTLHCTHCNGATRTASIKTKALWIKQRRGYLHGLPCLTHIPLDKMAAISQTTFSRAFLTELSVL